MPAAPPSPAAETVLQGRLTEATADLEAKLREREERLRRAEIAAAEREDRVSRREEALRQPRRRPPEEKPWYTQGGSSLLGD